MDVTVNECQRERERERRGEWWVGCGLEKPELVLLTF